MLLALPALVALTLALAAHAQTSYDPVSLAAALNLPNLFNYTFPPRSALAQYANTSRGPGNYTRGNNATIKYMRERWNLERESVQFGREDLAFVRDPADERESLVLAVRYPAGSYSHATGGAQFYSAFPTTGTASMLLTYSVYFPKNYTFVHGGKLPGLRGGTVDGCSGGEKTNGTTCFSARLMWRDKGMGEGERSANTSRATADPRSLRVHSRDQQPLPGSQRHLRRRVRHLPRPRAVYI